MKDGSVGSTEARRPGEIVTDLVKEHGRIENIPTDVLTNLGFQVVNSVINGEAMTSIVPINKRKKNTVKRKDKAELNKTPVELEDNVELSLESTYPLAEFSQETSTMLESLTNLKGDFGFYTKRINQESTKRRIVVIDKQRIVYGRRVIGPEHEETIKPHNKDGSILALWIDTKIDSKKRKLTTKRELEFSEDGSKIIAASIEESSSDDRHNPKVVTIAPSGLEDFTKQLLDIARHEDRLNPRAPGH